MHDLLKTLIAAAAIATGIPTASAHLVINEMMQSNIDCIMDDFNEFPDSWIELYNPGPDAESLADYSLGTKEKASKAFRLPSGSIPAGKYMVIYCDKAARGRHTDFRLGILPAGSVLTPDSLSQPLADGIYILRQGSTAKKVVIRLR